MGRNVGAAGDDTCCGGRSKVDHGHGAYRWDGYGLGAERVGTGHIFVDSFDGDLSVFWLFSLGYHRKDTVLRAVICLSSGSQCALATAFRHGVLGFHIHLEPKSG